MFSPLPADRIIMVNASTFLSSCGVKAGTCPDKRVIPVVYRRKVGDVIVLRMGERCRTEPLAPTPLRDCL